MVWGDDYHPIDYSKLLETHIEQQSPLTMTVTTEHSQMNLQFEHQKLVAYNKQNSEGKNLNGYEAGTSIIEKSTVLRHGKDGTWSWEETAYTALSGQAVVHLDSTQFWDMGTPEGLELLENFLNESAS